MRLVWICAFTLPLFAQMRVGTAMAGIRGPGPAARHSTPVPYRGTGWGTGYWGWGRGDGVITVLQSAPEVKAPILASSPLYQADRAQSVMREYGSLPAETAASEVALVAFRDGRVEPVRAYWVVGEQFAYVTKDDAVRKVPLNRVDVARSERLNRQQGAVFRIVE